MTPEQMDEIGADVQAAAAESYRPAVMWGCDHRGRVTFPRNPDGPPYCQSCFESATPAVWDEWNRQQRESRGE